MAGRFVLIRHGDEPDDDRVVTFFRDQGVEPEINRPFMGEALGDVDSSVVGSVIYGGPFNAFEQDRHPFLRHEARWIEQCMARNVPLLGICQGAQQIAHILGAKVELIPGGAREFGYYELTPTQAGLAYFPDRLVVCQAHSYGFDVPVGGELLASSRLFPHQAFKHGASSFAFLFHAEVTTAGFRRWQEMPWAGYGKPGVQSRAEQDVLMAAHDQTQHEWFMDFLGKLFGAAIGV